jgi:hypothetical protein
MPVARGGFQYQLDQAPPVVGQVEPVPRSLDALKSRIVHDFFIPHDAMRPALVRIISFNDVGQLPAP